MANTTNYIDLINRQGFEAFWDYCIHPIQTAQYHWEKYNAVGEGYQPTERVTFYTLPVLHYFGGFLVRLMLLPFSASVYVLSRFFLISLNVPNWKQNIAKTVVTNLIFTLFLLMVVNNAYEWLPAMTFPRLFHEAQLNTMYETFGLREGGWLFETHVIGGMLAGAMAIVSLASILYAGKLMGKLINAKKLNDPSGSTAPVYMTAPKYAHLMQTKTTRREPLDIANTHEQLKLTRNILNITQQGLKYKSPNYTQSKPSGNQHSSINILYQYYLDKKPVIYELNSESVQNKRTLQVSLAKHKLAT